MQIAQGFCVFGHAEGEVAFLEGGVAQVFQLGRDLEDVLAFPLVVGAGLLVFGEFFVGVAGRVNDLVGCVVVVFVLELAAV